MSAITPILSGMELVKVPIKATDTWVELSDQLITYEIDMMKNINDAAWNTTHQLLPWAGPLSHNGISKFLDICQESADRLLKHTKESITTNFDRSGRANSNSSSSSPKRCPARTGRSEMHPGMCCSICQASS